MVRVRERGGDVLTALAEVGPAVTLCSWTSIIGYSTLVIASNRALRSFGWYAVVGEMTCLCTALVMVPAFLLRAVAGLKKSAGDDFLMPVKPQRNRMCTSLSLPGARVTTGRH